MSPLLPLSYGTWIDNFFSHDLVYHRYVITYVRIRNETQVHSGFMGQSIDHGGVVLFL